MNKWLVYTIFLLLFVPLVNAGCSANILKGIERDVNGKPIELSVFNTGEELIIGSEVTRQLAGDRIVIDLVITDPDNYLVGNHYIQLPVNDSYGETFFNITNSFVNGTYTIALNMQELDENSSVICSYTTSETFKINSLRTSANTTSLNLSTDLLASLQFMETCKSYEQQGVVTTYCIKGYLPVGYELEFNEIEMNLVEDENFTVAIEMEQPQYSYAFMKNLFDAYIIQTDVSAGLSNQLNYTQGLTDEKDLIIASFSQELSQINQERLDTLQQEKEILLTENESLKNSNLWGVILGGIIALIVCGGAVYYYKYKSSAPLTG